MHSPFFLHPQLLPRLVRYLNRHPALSYAFAPDCVGSASQGPRADEGARERFDELPVALDWLARRGAEVTPDELWSTLAPLLVDLAGNSHRAELNVEKLFNPYLPGRGRMGVVELRALRMPPTPDRLVALAALFRAIAARLAVSPYEEPLLDWGPRLHGEWALPFFQREDLETVLLDLETHGLGLGPLLRAEILRGPEPWAEISLGNSTLELTPALSFWPLFGDVASQESAGSRFVDSSSSRLQILVRSEDGQARGTVSAHGWHVPLRTLPGGRQAIGIVTWRAFAPRPGLHPGVPPCDPLVLEWTTPQGQRRIALHGWNPLSGAYDGLPLDAAEARRRRLARVVITPLAAPTPAHTSEAGGFGLDLRAPSAPPPKLPA